MKKLVAITTLGAILTQLSTLYFSTVPVLGWWVVWDGGW